MKIIIGIILVLLLGGGVPAQEEDGVPDGRVYTFKLGILYIDSPTGNRFREGIADAVTDYNHGKEKPVGTVYSAIPYHNETDGLDKLVSMIRKGEVDIIIGPTDSGIFERAMEQRKEFEQYPRVPVISSRLTAKIPHRKGGWFFRTDINVERRARAMYDFLNKHWGHSVVVLFEGTEFGVRAERAFRGQLRGFQKDRYLSFSYDPAGGGRDEILRVLQLRPEAVGIFGTYKNIVPVYRSLKSMNTGWPRYLPLTFSLMDTRSIQSRPRNNYFVSLTGITERNCFDDVKGLAYDTTILILRELDTLAASETFDYGDPSWRRLFRDRFEAVLHGVMPSEQGKDTIRSKTGISFKNYENNTIPMVFESSKDRAGPTEGEEAVGFFGKIGEWTAGIWNRVEFYLVFNIFLIAIVCLFFCMWDIKGWSVGKKGWKAEIYSGFAARPFWLLAGANFIVTLFVYICFAETGGIRYDNSLSAFILSLVLAAVLRVTFFHPLFGRHYDNFTRWVYDNMGTYPESEIDKIADRTGVDRLRNILEDIFHDIPDREKRIRMRVRVEEIVKNRKETERSIRESLARLLLQYIGEDESLKDFVEEQTRET